MFSKFQFCMCRLRQKCPDSCCPLPGFEMLLGCPTLPPDGPSKPFSFLLRGTFCTCFHVTSNRKGEALSNFKALHYFLNNYHHKEHLLLPANTDSHEIIHLYFHCWNQCWHQAQVTCLQSPKTLCAFLRANKRVIQVLPPKAITFKQKIK